MKLEGIELLRVRLQLRQPWHWAGGRITEREVIVVRAVTPHSEGWGECSALSAPTYSPEWTEGALAVLRHHLVPSVMRGDDPSVVKGNHMARSALEMALLDAELRAEGVSLAARLGGTRTRVTAGVAIGLAGSLSELLDEVGLRVDEGYRRVKLKIRPGWDIAPVRAVRERFAQLALQVDANGSYRMTDAAELVRLDDFGLLCVEQPLADDDLLGHAALAEKMSTPICLDESINSAHGAASAIALGACGVVNIKAGRVGGYLEAVRIHDLCASHRIPVWCGGMLETGIGRSANLALASLPNFSLPGDLSASDRFYRDDLTEPIVLAHDGTLAVPDGPGTGAVLRLDVLDGSTVERRWCRPGSRL